MGAIVAFVIGVWLLVHSGRLVGSFLALGRCRQCNNRMQKTTKNGGWSGPMVWECPECGTSRPAGGMLADLLEFILLIPRALVCMVLGLTCIAWALNDLL